MKKISTLLLMAALSVSAAMAETTQVSVDEQTVVPVTVPAQETDTASEADAAVNTSESTEAEKPVADTAAAKEEASADTESVKEEATAEVENAAPASKDNTSEQNKKIKRTK